MRTDEIVPGVWEISLDFVNAFIVEGDGATLIDAGAALHLDRIREALSGRGRLRAIAATHYHVDHIGTVADLAGEDVTVYAHRDDAAGMRGEEPIPEPKFEGEEKERFDAFRESFGLRTPVSSRVDVLLDHGDLVPEAGLEVVHTPGHTGGHVCFLHRESGVLFVGDAAANVGLLTALLPALSEDFTKAIDSVRRIAELDFDIAVFGHGGVLRGKANKAFRKLIDSIAATEPPT